jgi:Phage tail baseplate hub (GPD)
MTVTVQLALNGTPVPQTFYSGLESLEVEESCEGPDLLVLRVPVNRTSAGDLQYVGDGTFEPYTGISMVVTPSGQSAQCVFDGYVLSWQLHLDRTSSSSTLDVAAQDASWLMNIDDTVKEWSGQTDGQVANTIFNSYGFTPADANTDDDSPTHDPEGHTLFQRATDLQFLKGLARRAGKICRVACTDTAGQRTGYFIRASVDAQPAATISLVDPVKWTVDTLDFDWDVMRPSQVDASQVDLTQASDDGTETDTDTSGLTTQATRDLPTYTGRTSTLLLTTPADVPELPQRTAAVLTESGFFTRCTGEADADRLGAVLRAGDVVTIAGAGAIHSGNWLVWAVRHKFELDSYKMRFTLVRNGVGAAPAAAGGLAGAAAGAIGGAV